MELRLYIAGIVEVWEGPQLILSTNTYYIDVDTNIIIDNGEYNRGGYWSLPITGFNMVGDAGERPRMGLKYRTDKPMYEDF